ncbi:MAG: hypothetical protein RQ735_12045 [Flavobacteriaceae bacterium]|nr:hypothetical protein [Flavobacteriaceae bacterium]
MKTLKLAILGMIFFLTGLAQAQISLDLHIGSAPQWGPQGYDEARYYYLPDVEAYYDIQGAKFIYNVSGSWVYKSRLPKKYRNYDLYSGYKVVMTDYHGNTPYTYYPEHRKKYAKGYRGNSQNTIGKNPGKGNSNKGKHPGKKKRGNGNN